MKNYRKANKKMPSFEVDNTIHNVITQNPVTASSDALIFHITSSGTDMLYATELIPAVHLYITLHS